MTFAETQKIVAAINEVATWASSLTRETAKEELDLDKLKRMEKWLDEAKQTVFELCSK